MALVFGALAGGAMLTTTALISAPFWMTFHAVATQLGSAGQNLVEDKMDETSKLMHQIVTNIKDIECDKLGDFSADCASLQLGAQYTLGNATEWIDGNKCHSTSLPVTCIVTDIIAAAPDALKKATSDIQIADIVETAISPCVEENGKIQLQCLVQLPIGLVMAAAGEEELAKVLGTDIKQDTAKTLLKLEPIETIANASKGVMCSLSTMVLGFKEALEGFQGKKEEEQKEESTGLFGGIMNTVGGFVGDRVEDLKSGLVQGAKGFIDEHFKDAKNAVVFYSNSVYDLAGKFETATCSNSY